MIYISKNKTIHFAEISDEEKSDDKNEESKDVKKEEEETDNEGYPFGDVEDDKKEEVNEHISKYIRGGYTKEDLHQMDREHDEKFGYTPNLEGNVNIDDDGMSNLNIPGVRNSILGSDRRLERDLLALNNRRVAWGAKPIEDLPENQVGEKLRRTNIPPQNNHIKIDDPSKLGTIGDYVQLRKDVPVFNLGASAVYHPGFNSVVVNPHYFTPFMDKNNIQSKPYNYYISQGRNNLQPSSVFDVIHHEISHANGWIPQDIFKIKKPDGVINPYYYKNAPNYLKRLQESARGQDIKTSYPEFDPNEYISFLGVAKDELQAHHPELGAKDIETFDQLEKQFKDRTYTDEHGTVRYKINDRPVSREAYRVWETLKAAPQTREGFRFYNPFVQNRKMNGVNTQQYQGGRVPQRWNQSMAPQGWNSNPSAVG